MAEAFKNATLTLTTTMTDLYVCPANTRAVVMMLQATNIHASAAADVTAVLSDASAAGAETEIVFNLTIPTQSSVGLFAAGQKLILEPGDKLRIKATAATNIRVIASVTELS
jgi:hypothetical protein